MMFKLVQYLILTHIINLIYLYILVFKHYVSGLVKGAGGSNGGCNPQIGHV